MARAGLSWVVEQGDPNAYRTFASLSTTEAWDRLRMGDVTLGPWLQRMEQADPQRDLDRAEAAGIRFVIPGDDEWPSQLEDLQTAGQFARRGATPYGLWVRGEPSLREALAKSVAIVGARACSSYGAHLTSDLASDLADNRLTVISGGAFGIDTAAHRGALAADGATVAFLPSGVDVDYPRSNSVLFDRIAETGLLVSERPPGSVPTKIRFFARNRLIAASTLATVVTEAALRSGSLNTAGWAASCRRPVLAVPGPITSATSTGTNQLIRDRRATLITDAAHVLEAISPTDEPLIVRELGPHRIAERRIDEANDLTPSPSPGADPAPGPTTRHPSHAQPTRIEDTEGPDIHGPRL